MRAKTALWVAAALVVMAVAATPVAAADPLVINNPSFGAGDWLGLVNFNTLPMVAVCGTWLAIRAKDYMLPKTAAGKKVTKKARDKMKKMQWRNRAMHLFFSILVAGFAGTGAFFFWKTNNTDSYYQGALGAWVFYVLSMAFSSALFRCWRFAGHSICAYVLMMAAGWTVFGLFFNESSTAAYIFLAAAIYPTVMLFVAAYWYVQYKKMMRAMKKAKELEKKAAGAGTAARAASTTGAEAAEGGEAEAEEEGESSSSEDED